MPADRLTPETASSYIDANVAVTSTVYGTVDCKLSDGSKIISLDQVKEPAPSWATEDLAELMSKAPAICEAVRRLIAGAFRRDGERLASDACPRFSIPCRPDHDDDIVVLDWIAALVKASGLLPTPPRTTEREATLDMEWWQ